MGWRTKRSTLELTYTAAGGGHHAVGYKLAVIMKSYVTYFGGCDIELYEQAERISGGRDPRVGKNLAAARAQEQRF